MACGSGCCGSPNKGSGIAGDKQTVENVKTSVQTPDMCESDNEADSIADSCCEKSADSSHLATLLSEKKVEGESKPGCTKGCCSSKVEGPSVKAEAVSKGKNKEESCTKSCCSKPKDPVKISDVGCTEGCCSKPKEAVKKSDVGCTKGCCSSKPVKTDKDCQDVCCDAPVKVAESKAACTKGCCGPKPVQVDKADMNCKKDDCTEATSTSKASESKPSCTKGCCGPKSAKESETKSECTKGCCSKPKTGIVAKPDQIEKDGKEDCCADAPSKPPCTKGCCGAKPPVLPATSAACNKGCCSKPKETLKIDAGCAKSCCSKPKPAKTIKPDSKPPCCKGKTTPCCDESCIEQLALLECEKQLTLSSQNGGRSSCDGGESGHPCKHHAQKTRAMYSEKLEALGCICRTLLQMGLESCCDLKTRAAAKKRRAAGRCSSLRSSPSRSSSSSSCGGNSCKSGRRGRRSCSISSCGPATKSCADACCSESPGCEEKDKGGGTREKTMPIFTKIDSEKGLAANKEHVVLNISGMTCTGCETKLSRSLGMLPTVTNLKTSLVLARAEFDLINSSVEEVTKHIERTTEFSCERIMTEGSSLDLSLPRDTDAAVFINQEWPDGVLDMSVIDVHNVRLSYDPKIVGARSIMGHPWEGGPVKLSPPRADPTIATGRKHVRHLGYATILSAILTIPVLVMAWAPLPDHALAYGSASMALATIVQIAIAGPFYPKAIKALVFSKVIEMDLLIVLSTSAAYIFSVVSFGYLAAGHPLSTGEFFETSTLLVTLIMLGRFVAALARQRAVESISMQSLQATTVLLVHDNGSDEEIDAQLLQYGDVFRVLPDSRIATDGNVLSGESEVDESMVTGESMPVTKGPSSAVLAGSINGSGQLTVRLSQLPGSNTISRLNAMVDEAKLSKPKIQDMADRVASYFVPVVVSLTIITFVIWIAVGVKVRRQSGSEATIHAITYAMTVLIASCPCAIGLAVPMVIVIASGLAAEHGVVFTSAETIEAARNTRHVVFDKTGTLTEGKLATVSETYPENNNKMVTTEIKSLLLGLVQNIKHPVAIAVASHLAAQEIVPSTDVSDVNALAGKGIEGRTVGNSVLLQAGNARWLAVTNEPAVQTALGKGCTVFCFVVDGVLMAVFGLQDAIRAESASTVATLQQNGIDVHILSGDEHGAVQTVASALNIPPGNIRSRCSPAEKRDYIQQLLETPVEESTSKNDRNKPVVMFCGDGTNDAVALSQATIGVHISHEGGTDIAKAAADVVLMNPSLSGILVAISLSKKAMRRVLFNFGWSFVYNLFAILLGAGAFVRARIPPEYAGLGELVSVLPVIFAAVLLRWSKI